MARSGDWAVKTAEQAESGDFGPEPHAAVATPLSPKREWRSTRKHCGIPQPFLSVGQCELPRVGGCKEPEAGRLSLPILRQQNQEEEAVVQLPNDKCPFTLPIWMAFIPSRVFLKTYHLGQKNLLYPWSAHRRCSLQGDKQTAQ